MVNQIAEKTPALTPGEKKLLAFIPSGSERPRSLNELVSLTGWNSRMVRATINRLVVVHHLPIGAIYKRTNGYFRITSNDERKTAVAPLQSQINELNKRVSVLKRAKLGNE